LDDPEDIAVRIADVELDTVGHLAEGHGERNARRREADRKCLRTLNNEAGIDVFIALKGGLIAERRRGALKMDVAAVTAHAGVKVLVTELKLEPELFAVESKRARKVCNSEHWRDISKASGTLIHRVLAKTPVDGVSG
jgi:hypothetical protein